MKTKQLIYTALIFIFSINLISAQEKITIPEMTNTQKHKRVYFIANSVLMVGANYAKAQGKTVEDFARHYGELSKYTWNIKDGYDGFVKGTLYNWESWRPSTSPAIQILKQTDKSFQFKTPLVIKQMLGGKPYYDITFEELIVMYKIIFEVIAEHLGVNYQQKLIDDGNWLEITITK